VQDGGLIPARHRATTRLQPIGGDRVHGRSLAIAALLLCLLLLSGALAQSADAYSLAVSTQANRASPADLAGQTYQQSSVIYVFTQPTTGVARVSFYLDDPSRVRSPRQVESQAEYDFAGTAGDGRANGFSLGSLATGTHTITAAILKTDGQTQVLSGTFSVAGTTTAPPDGTLVFEDNFDGTALNTTHWSAWYSAGHGGNGLRRPSAFTVANGMLVVTAKMVDGKIVSGGMSHRHDQIYGRYEFRVRTEVDPTGTMSGVVMTWPKYQWSPEFTESDIYETGVAVNTRWGFKTFIHYGYSYSTQKIFSHAADASQWHTMVMDWRQSSLRIYRDGALVWTLTDTAAIPDVLHHFGIQLDARATRTLTTPVRMYVDYVRIYR
jgi:hypothetical protein